MRKALFAILFLGCLLLSACERQPTWQEEYDLGMRYLSEGNYEEAIIAFTAAIEIDPKRAEAYVGLADVYIAQGDYDAARAVLTDASERVDNLQLIEEKLTEVEALIAWAAGDTGQAEDLPDASDEAESPAPSETSPTEEPDYTDVPEEEESPAQEEPPEEPAEEAPIQDEPVQEEPVQEEPVQEEILQLPQSYTQYQYVVDMLETVSFWDVYKSMEQISFYPFQVFFPVTVGYTIDMMYETENSEASLCFSTGNFCMPDALSELILDVPNGSQFPVELALPYSDRLLIRSVTGSCNPSVAPIHPLLGDGITFDQMVQICEENNLSYRTDINSDFLVASLTVDLRKEKNRTFGFSWTGYETEDELGDMLPNSFMVQIYSSERILAEAENNYNES